MNKTLSPTHPKNLKKHNPFAAQSFIHDFLLLSMAKELAASLEKSTEARLRRFSSDNFTKRSATGPRKVGNAFICIAMSSICQSSHYWPLWSIHDFIYCGCAKLLINIPEYWASGDACALMPSSRHLSKSRILSRTGPSRFASANIVLVIRMASRFRSNNS